MFLKQLYYRWIFDPQAYPSAFSNRTIRSLVQYRGFWKLTKTLFPIAIIGLAIAKPLWREVLLWYLLGYELFMIFSNEERTNTIRYVLASFEIKRLKRKKLKQKEIIEIISNP